MSDMSARFVKVFQLPLMSCAIRQRFDTLDDWRQSGLIEKGSMDKIMDAPVRLIASRVAALRARVTSQPISQVRHKPHQQSVRMNPLHSLHSCHSSSSARPKTQSSACQGLHTLTARIRRHMSRHLQRRIVQGVSLQKRAAQRTLACRKGTDSGPTLARLLSRCDDRFPSPHPS